MRGSESSLKQDVCRRTYNFLSKEEIDARAFECTSSIV